MSKGQCLLWYMTAKAASRRHCFTWIHPESCTTLWLRHPHPLPPSMRQHHTPLFFFFFFPRPRTRSLWASAGTSAGTRRLSDSRFSRQKHSWLIVLYFPFSSFFSSCRVLQWIKTCSFSARQPAAPLIDRVWLLCAVNLIFLVVKKKRKEMKKSWFNEGVSGIDKPTWRQTSFGGRAEREMCCLLSVM